MKILNVNQTRECDAYTINSEPISSIDLMERAANKLFEWISVKYVKDKHFVILAGTGNNGGDALALARMLLDEGFVNIKVFVVKTSETFSTDCLLNLDRLNEIGKEKINTIINNGVFPNMNEADIVVDGIFGSGLSRPIEGYWATFVEYINTLKAARISIDVPSGAFADNYSGRNGVIIKADITLSFQFPKMAFFFSENNDFIGRWYVLDIGLSKEYITKVQTQYYYLTSNFIKTQLTLRNKFSHKGNFGHAFLVAGSYQKTGAAILAAKGCLRSGVGLLTVHVPQSAYAIMQTAVPEAMLCIDETELSACNKDVFNEYAAIGIGPGIGKKQSMVNALKRILNNYQKPMVFDADAINILADNDELLAMVPKDSVLTPHPGEFDRLTKKHSLGSERLETQIELAKKMHCYIVLKGGHSTICTPSGEVYFNSTGNPGMATAGSGDVLTGIILSLLAQGYGPKKSALIGVFIHGLAGDISEKEVGQEALIASDIICNLGNAFIKVK